ncbi:hypothetical protein ES708_20973 [subsurface metagenome]
MEDFKNSTNNGFMVTGSSGSQLITLRLKNNLWTLKLNKDGKLIPVDSQCPDDYDVKEFKKTSAIVSTVLKDYNYLIESLEVEDLCTREPSPVRDILILGK